MVVLFSAMGILLWVGLLLAALVFFGVIWVIGQTVIWAVQLVSLLTRPDNSLAASNRNVRPAPNPAAPPRDVPPSRTPPAPKPAARQVTPDIVPKWNAAHRRYVNRDLADWQEQFEALNSRE